MELPTIVRVLSALVGALLLLAAWQRAVEATPRTTPTWWRWAVVLQACGGAMLLVAGTFRPGWLLPGAVLGCTGAAVVYIGGLLLLPVPQLQPTREPQDWDRR